jgi:DNA-binding response OmpR family regulator
VRLRGTPGPALAEEVVVVRTLASDPTRVFTKHQLLRTIWGFRTRGQRPLQSTHMPVLHVGPS